VGVVHNLVLVPDIDFATEVGYHLKLKMLFLYVKFFFVACFATNIFMALTPFCMT